jgi:hypothetical protein
MVLFIDLYPLNVKILMNAYVSYKNNNFKFDIPNSITNRTFQYLEKSCHFLSWFKEHFHFVKGGNDNTFVSI